MGLRLTAKQSEDLFRGLGTMKESATFQATLAEGEKHALLGLGRKRFGPPDEAALKANEAIDDPDRVEGLLERLLDASSWSDLLGPPTSQTTLR